MVNSLKTMSSFWVKKEEMAEGRNAGWASKIKPGMDTPLIRMQEIMAVAFIKTNIQSKMVNATTMIPCRHV